MGQKLKSFLQSEFFCKFHCYAENINEFISSCISSVTYGFQATKGVKTMAVNEVFEDTVVLSDNILGSTEVNNLFWSISQVEDQQSWLWEAVYSL